MVEALICTENWLQAKLFVNPVYNLQEDIKEQIFHMELQEGNIFLILYKVKMYYNFINSIYMYLSYLLISFFLTF